MFQTLHCFYKLKRIGGFYAVFSSAFLLKTIDFLLNNIILSKKLIFGFTKGI